MTARDQRQSLWLERAFVGTERHVRDGDAVLGRDDHEQRRRGNARDPCAGFVHAGGAGRSDRDLVLPDAVGDRLEIEVDRFAGAIGDRHGRIVADEHLSVDGCG